MDFLVIPQTSNSLIDCYSSPESCTCQGTHITCTVYTPCNCNLNVPITCPKKYCDNKACTIKADIKSVP